MDIPTVQYSVHFNKYLNAQRQQNKSPYDTWWHVSDYILDYWCICAPFAVGDSAVRLLYIRKEELSKTSTSCPVPLPSEAITQNTPWYSIILPLQILTPFTIICQMITHTYLCPSTTAEWIFVKLVDQFWGVWLLFLFVWWTNSRNTISSLVRTHLVSLCLSLQCKEEVGVTWFLNVILYSVSTAQIHIDLLYRYRQL